MVRIDLFSFFVLLRWYCNLPVVLNFFFPFIYLSFLNLAQPKVMVKPEVWSSFSCLFVELWHGFKF